MGEGRIDKRMKDNEITQANLLLKYINNPFFKFLLRKVFIPCYFMNFIKVIESKIVFRYLDINSNDRICDIACGCGEQSIKMAKKDCNVYGVDRDGKGIKIAKALSENKCNFIIGDAEKLPLKSGIFDKVVSVCALEHFRNDEKAIEEMNRILKPGGVLVLTVDSFTYKGVKKHLREKHRVRHFVVNYYSASKLKAKLEKCGFKVEDVRYFVNSPLSVLFFNLFVKNIWISTIIFPIALTITIISDLLKGKKDEGIFLAVKTKKECKNESVCNLYS